MKELTLLVRVILENVRCLLVSQDFLKCLFNIGRIGQSPPNDDTIVFFFSNFGNLPPVFKIIKNI